jgi:hypothetical protein
MEEAPIERVRRICLSLPEATEKEAWGEPTFRIRDRLFAMYASGANHHGAGREALWCHAPPGAQEFLVASAPERFFVPAYVGVRGWIGIVLDRTDDLELEVHVRQAYCVVAPKKLIAVVEGQGS